jgi:AraC family transcriptional regulator
MVAQAAPRNAGVLRSADVAGFRLVEGRHAGGSALPWHVHDGPTICFVLRGRFLEGFRSHTLDCEPAMVKFTPADERHYNRFDWGDTHGLLIEVSPERYEALRPHAAVLDQLVHLRGGVPAVLAHRIHRELGSADSAAPLAMEGLLLELIASVSRRRGSGAAPAPRWVRDAQEILRTRLADGVSLAELAASVGTHPVTLTRAFRRAFGCSVGEYLRRLRIERAVERLARTDVPLAQIAVEAGFADQSHFSNLFRRRTGMSPSSYRRSVRGAAQR